MSTVQVVRFQNGGFVLHRITGAFTGFVSMWFNSDGQPIDAERFDGKGVGRSFPVKVGGPIWEACRMVGARYLQTAAVGGPDRIV